MSELKIERIFESDPETVFAFVTEGEKLLQWWGHEGMTIPEHNLDFSGPGPWMATLVGAEGGRYKMSGEVIAVDPPNSVEFTWGWHDENDERGHDSKVRFEVKAVEDGTHFKMIHSGLANEDSVNGHEQGWTSAYRKLERLLN